MELALTLRRGLPNPVRLLDFDRTPHLAEEYASLAPSDLLIALFSFDAYIGRGANRYFSPFAKPEGLRAKYAFVRLGIPARSLLQGLATPKQRVYGTLDRLRRFAPGSRLRVTGAAGTDITLQIAGFSTCAHEIVENGGMAFLPPSEASAEVLPGTASGRIVVDVTVGQLYYNQRLLAPFGLVDAPVTLRVENGRVTDVSGGAMADALREKLFALPPACRELVELGHGLSDMTPTGLIGVDESLLGTCHFGIGDGAACGVHLDVVVANPAIHAQTRPSA